MIFPRPKRKESPIAVVSSCSRDCRVRGGGGTQPGRGFYLNPSSAISICRTPQEPRPDIAICSECGWRGLIEKCLTEKEGNYEDGYYDIHLCPKCENGGCIDDYDMSSEQVEKWLNWNMQNK